MFNDNILINDIKILIWVIDLNTTLFCPVLTKRDEAMPLYASTIGMTPEERHILRPDGISDYQLLYSVRGTGEGRIFGRSFEIPTGSLFCLPPNLPHDYSMCGDTWQTAWITFGGWAAASLFDVEACVLTLPAGFDFMQRFDELMRYKDSAEWHRMSGMLLYGLLLELNECISEEGATIYAQKNRMTECMRYIDRNFSEELSLACLAEVCGVSEEHFCRSFRLCTGMRPFEYINRLRVQKAKEYMVEYGKMSCREIGRRCGFGSGSYFSLMFRREVGMTPTEYRRQLLGDRGYT